MFLLVNALQLKLLNRVEDVIYRIIRAVIHLIASYAWVELHNFCRNFVVEAKSEGSLCLSQIYLRRVYSRIIDGVLKRRAPDQI